MHLKYITQEQYNGEEAQKILRKEFQISGTLIKKIKNSGFLFINSVPSRMVDTVKTGDVVETVFFDTPEEIFGNLKNDTQIQIIYEDEYFAAVSKPPYMVTHPCYLNHQNALTSKLGGELLHPVNRLDKDTSGIVLLAKNSYTHTLLSSCEIEKEYIALVHGDNMFNHGTIDMPIGREPGSIMLRIISENGKRAVTSFEVLRRFKKSGISLIKLKLHTGRTHQLRLHCMMIGHPIVGETLYGANRLFSDWPIIKEKKSVTPDTPTDHYVPGASYQGEFLIEKKKLGEFSYLRPVNMDINVAAHWDSIMDRQALHAFRTSFEHPVSHQKLNLYSPIPEDISNIIKMAEKLEITL